MFIISNRAMSFSIIQYDQLFHSKNCRLKWWRRLNAIYLTAGRFFKIICKHYQINFITFYTFNIKADSIVAKI